MDYTGWRTFVFGILCLVSLYAGAWIVRDPVTYDHFAWAVVGVMTTIAARNAVDLLASGNGVKGIAKVLLTDAKPGDPAPKP